MIEGRDIDVPRHLGQLQQTLQLAGKQQSMRLTTIDKRLLAEAVSAQDQSLLPRIPDGHGKHPVQVLEAVHSEIFVQMHDDFTVAMRAERVTGSLQATPQRAKVVDLAIEDDPHRAVFICQRLACQSQVDNRQPAKTEGHTGTGTGRGLPCAFTAVVSVVVRSTMAQDIGHPPQCLGADDLFGS